MVDWDDPSVEWDAYAVVVVRSTWDYPLRRDEFLAWADGVAGATQLANPPDVLRWNTDKRYLRELEASGIPIVPTTWVEPGEDPALSALPADGPFVVKPAVSAGAKDTARYDASQVDAAREHIETLTRAGRTSMVQAYVAAIEERGETGLVYAAGEFSHAIRKAAILGPDIAFVEGLYAEERITPREPSPEERALAEEVLNLVPGGRHRLLYARVDVVPRDDGTPMLLELEAAEPSLFLEQAPDAAERFAVAITGRLTGG